MMTDRVKMNDQGRIVVPARLRRELGMKGGDTLLLRVEDGELRVIHPRAALRRMQDELARRHPDDTTRWSDVLIAERREEARREAEELDALDG